MKDWSNKIGILIVLTGLMNSEKQGLAIEQSWEADPLPKLDTLKQSLAADRTLTKEEKEWLTAMRGYLKQPLPIKYPSGPLHAYDRAVRWRGEAVFRLGLFLAHSEIIPDLETILNNQEEAEGVRIKAVYALSVIPDKAAIPVLIRALADENPTIRFNAWDRLFGLGVGRDLGLDSNTSIEKCRQQRTLYEVWWSEHQDNFIMRNHGRLFNIR